MNVYEAIEVSPVRVARHDKGRVLTESDSSISWCARNMRSGWQPLYVSPAEYTLGEPLTEAVKGQRCISVRKVDGTVKQGHFTYGGKVDNTYWTYYADPRPLPKLPEKKPTYTYRDCGECFRIERDGKDFCAVEYRSDAELLVGLLNESEGE